MIGKKLKISLGFGVVSTFVGFGVVASTNYVFPSPDLDRADNIEKHISSLDSDLRKPIYYRDLVGDGGDKVMGHYGSMAQERVRLVREKEEIYENCGDVLRKRETLEYIGLTAWIAGLIPFGVAFFKAQEE